MTISPSIRTEMMIRQTESSLRIFRYIADRLLTVGNFFALRVEFSIFVNSRI
jgi:hypothetical protein